MEKKVSRKIRSHISHIICLEGLRALQKDCWSWEKRLKHRNSRLDSFLKKNTDEGQAVTSYQVKLKLSLMNEKIGFGWVRQNALFRRKTWGFYFLTSEDSTTTSTIGVPSVSSLKAIPTIEVTDCSDDFRGRGDNPCVIAQENDKQEYTEKKEQKDAVVVPMIEKIIAECIHEIKLEENILVV
ncbi:Hypothetical predicted protein [Mytilus galloprovincialis]|uniref:Uncharacterized protein n=1 Tax=Mytilus galloprovincialis TaxID=29158 RepID=A0A8B6CN52_MYTGA|nr:Hypothetical predicted protein [Mytilus galloprovincialis]